MTDPTTRELIAEPRGCPTPGACSCPTAPYVPPDLIRALELAEAALADIGDAERESGDDLAWAESRAAQDLPRLRAVLARLGRPKPLSLKEQSIALLDLIQGNQQLWQLEDLDVIRRALELIPDPAQPEPEGPTDEEIMRLMPQQMHEDLAAAARALAEQASTISPSATGIMRIMLNRHAVDLARAVLACWGSQPQ
jgi:hypothetical protein